MAIKFFKDDRGFHSLDTATNIETSYDSEHEVNYAMLVEMLRHGERLEQGLARLSLTPQARRIGGLVENLDEKMGVLEAGAARLGEALHTITEARP